MFVYFQLYVLGKMEREVFLMEAVSEKKKQKAGQIPEFQGLFCNLQTGAGGPSVQPEKQSKHLHALQA